MYKTTLIVLATVLLFASCEKQNPIDETSTTIQQVDNVEDLVINPNFDWKMTQSVELNLSSHSNAIIKIVDDQGRDLQKAYVKAENIQQFNVELPAHTQSLNVYFGKHMVALPIDGNVINYRQL